MSDTGVICRHICELAAEVRRLIQKEGIPIQDDPNPDFGPFTEDAVLALLALTRSFPRILPKDAANAVAPFAKLGPFAIKCRGAILVVELRWWVDWNDNKPFDVETGPGPNNF